MKKMLFAFMITLLLISCNRQVAIEGIILDEETRQPVNGVLVSQKELVKNTVVWDLDSSDAKGFYKYEHMLTGKSADSSFVTLYFFKNGLTLARNIQNGDLNDTLLLPAMYRSGERINIKPSQ
jgi:hypothetical protein